MSGILQRLRGALFGFMLMLSLVSWGMVWFPLVAPLLFIAPNLAQSIICKLGGVYYELFATMLRGIHGVKTSVTGDMLRHEENALFIANHRTRLDWMFLWQVLQQQRTSPRLRIVLKNDIRKIPIVGNAAELLQFMFLVRQWAADAVHIAKMCLVYMRTNTPFHLFIFPEGTDRSELNLERSRTYAQKNNLPEYSMILHPRTTGFIHMFKQLTSMQDPEFTDDDAAATNLTERTITAVYDMTVAYDGKIPQNEKCLFTGDMPHHVHWHIKRIPIEDVLSRAKNLQALSSTEWSSTLRSITASDASNGDQISVDNEPKDCDNNHNQVNNEIKSKQSIDIGLGRWVQEMFAFKELSLHRYHSQKDSDYTFEQAISITERGTKKQFTIHQIPLVRQLIIAFHSILSLSMLFFPLYGQYWVLANGFLKYEVAYIAFTIGYHFAVKKLFGGWDKLATRHCNIHLKAR